MTGPVFHSPLPDLAAQLHQRLQDRLQAAIDIFEPAADACRTNLGYAAGLRAALAIIKETQP